MTTTATKEDQLLTKLKRMEDGEDVSFSEDEIDALSSVAISRFSAEGMVELIAESESKIREEQYKLAGMLWGFDALERYKEIGYDSFRQFAQAELTMAYKKANRLRRIWSMIKAMGLDASDVDHIAPSRFRICANVIPEHEWANADEQEVVNIMETASSAELRKQLSEYANELLGNEGSVPHEDIASNTKTFSLTDEELEVVEEAISKARDEEFPEGSGHNDSACIVEVCREYNS